jgi:hypothetical protein
MKLSQLVQIYNQICEFDYSELKNSTSLELEKTTTTTPDDSLELSRKKLINHFDEFIETIESEKIKIKKQISDQERSYMLDSYKTYEALRKYKYEWFYNTTSDKSTADLNIKLNVDRILSTSLDISDQGAELIKGRILQQSGWQNTTMILHPAKQSLVTTLVSNDPLYLVDENYELLRPVVSQFTSAYQGRVRTCIIKEDTNKEILCNLPDNQFGLVLSWDYFNHRPFEIIRTYMIEIYKKLRPGGHFMMTFNDCDRWQGVRAVESKSALYTPGLLIKSFAARLGFEETYTWHEGGPWTWIEFRKPGSWTSLRGGQTLAKIIPKPVA